MLAHVFSNIFQSSYSALGSAILKVDTNNFLSLHFVVDFSFVPCGVKEVNKDLTRKLEAQTQRLELLTAQSMATGNNQARQPDALSVHDSTTYADEGDEVTFIP